MKRKYDIDARIALEMGYDLRDVSVITAAFLETIVETLVGLEEVQLAGFGKIRVKTIDMGDQEIELTSGTLKRGEAGRRRRVRVKRKFHVYVAKSAIFNRALREKHGPNTQEGDA